MQRSSRASLFPGSYMVVERSKICASVCLVSMDQKRALEPPETGEWMVGSHSVGAGNRAPVLSKSYKCS